VRRVIDTLRALLPAPAESTTDRFPHEPSSRPRHFVHAVQGAQDQSVDATPRKIDAPKKLGKATRLTVVFAVFYARGIVVASTPSTRKRGSR
jgi:hypothetical protein